MGNAVGGDRKRAKVMKIDGETFKLRLPATAADALEDYPAGYVLLESGAVKRCGIRAPRLRREEELRPGKIYFLVEMPKFPEPKITRRAESLPHTSCARERLESLMMLRQKSAVDMGSGSGSGPGSGPLRVKMMLPRAEIEKVMEESRDEAEVADRILDLCLKNSSTGPARLKQ